MFLRGLTAVAALATLGTLANCGVIYTVPAVHDGAPYGDGYGTDFDVEVVSMTYESAAAANLESYIPPRLPAVFQPGALQEAVVSSAGQMNLPAPENVTYGLPPRGRSEPYRIGVGDELLLAVKGLSSLEGLPDLVTAQAKRDSYTVQSDGSIAIPDAGRVEVAGMTLEDAEAEIFEALFAANMEPSFSLEVSGFNSQHVSVAGLVGRSGPVPITVQPLRLYEAIDAAGGVITDDPTIATIQLLRDGKAYRFGVDRLINDPAARRIILRDGDSIYVGSAEESVRERIAEERASFDKRLSLGAVEQYYVFMTGEVQNGQAVLPFEQPIHLANVLFGEPGGGINIQTGDFGAIYVLRAETDPRKAGGMTAYHLDAENVANLAVATRFEMRPNDIVFVAEQPVTSWNRVLSQIFPVVSAPARLANTVSSTGAGIP